MVLLEVMFGEVVHSSLPVFLFFLSTVLAVALSLYLEKHRK